MPAPDLKQIKDRSSDGEMGYENVLDIISVPPDVPGQERRTNRSIDVPAHSSTIIISYDRDLGNDERMEGNEEYIAVDNEAFIVIEPSSGESAEDMYIGATGNRCTNQMRTTSYTMSTAT